MQYTEVVNHLNDKARYKLSNMMAHGYEIKTAIYDRLGCNVIIERGDKLYMINEVGDVYQMQKCL